MLRTCLIAAHDPWFIQLLRVYSEESGFRVVQAYEGQDVLPVILQESPQVILLQADLPGRVRTAEVLKSIHNDPRAMVIPLLVFSWDGHESLSDGQGGVIAHLTEPVTYDAFVDALNQAGISL